MNIFNIFFFIFNLISRHFHFRSRRKTAEFHATTFAIIFHVFDFALYCHCCKNKISIYHRQKDGLEESNAFLEAFNLRRDYIFSDAEYRACNSRHAKLRRPQQLPKRERDDLHLFKTLLSAQVHKFTGVPYHTCSSNASETYSWQD